jgi:hypothetical protein
VGLPFNFFQEGGDHLVGVHACSLNRFIEAEPKILRRKKGRLTISSLRQSQPGYQFVNKELSHANCCTGWGASEEFAAALTGRVRQGWCPQLTANLGGSEAIRTLDLFHAIYRWCATFGVYHALLKEVGKWHKMA